MTFLQFYRHELNLENSTSYRLILSLKLSLLYPYGLGKQLSSKFCWRSRKWRTEDRAAHQQGNVQRYCKYGITKFPYCLSLIDTICVEDVCICVYLVCVYTWTHYQWRWLTVSCWKRMIRPTSHSYHLSFSLSSFFCPYFFFLLHRPVSYVDCCTSAGSCCLSWL